MPVIVLTDERDGLAAGDAVEDGQAGQGGAGTSVAAPAGDLHSFGRGALPGFGQRGQYVGFAGRQPEIRPPDPARFPGKGRRPAAEQVDAERRARAVRHRVPEAPAPHQPARGQPHDPRCRRVPGLAHIPESYADTQVARHAVLTVILLQPSSAGPKFHRTYTYEAIPESRV